MPVEVARRAVGEGRQVNAIANHFDFVFGDAPAEQISPIDIADSENEIRCLETDILLCSQLL